MAPFAVGKTSSDLKSVDDSSAYLPWFLSTVAGCLSELTLRKGVVLNMGVLLLLLLLSHISCVRLCATP